MTYADYSTLCIGNLYEDSYRIEIVAVPFLEDEQNKRRCHRRATQAQTSKFPSLFPFSCPCVHSSHEKDDVEGRAKVEELEYKVPWQIRRFRPEKIEIT